VQLARCCSRKRSKRRWRNSCDTAVGNVHILLFWPKLPCAASESARVKEAGEESCNMALQSVHMCPYCSYPQPPLLLANLQRGLEQKRVLPKQPHHHRHHRLSRLRLVRACVCLNCVSFCARIVVYECVCICSTCTRLACAALLCNCLCV
jgi:hypothetical protein